jgi:ribosomal protein L40E
VKCGTLNPDEYQFCGKCGSSLTPTIRSNDETSPLAISLMAVGGMLLFFSFFFGLVAAIAVPGFWIPTLIIALIAMGMMVAGYKVHLRKRKEEEEEVVEIRERGRCEYCGSMNPPNSIECEFCGAPLG